jgi:sulfur-oxidizing protein SoxY
MPHNRRTVLKTTGAMATLLALGIVTAEQAQAVGRPGFEARTLHDALRALGAQPVSSDQVAIQSPDIAENGASVQISIASRLPNTQEMFLLVERNPFPLAAVFVFHEGAEPEMQVNIKMAESSDIIVVAKADGRLFSARRQTRVTLGGCGA